MRLPPPSSRTPSLPGLALAGLLAAAVAVPVAAFQTQADFRADVELVRLNVAVVNPSGGEVPPLSEDDFTVYDDGVPQQVELFLRPTDAPLEVALVLDSSTSMRPVAGSSRRAALTFLSQLDPDDCVLVLPFSERVRAGRRGPAVDPGLRLFIDGVVAGGGTALYDALLRGLDELDRPPAEPAEEPAGPPAETGPSDDGVRRRRASSGAGSLEGRLGRVAADIAAGESSIVGSCPAVDDAGGGQTAERRKAIVLLSDGADEDSAAGFDEVLLAARQASVPLFPVAFGYARQDSRLGARLTELARATGGRRLQSATPERLRAAYAEALEYLRASYVLGYHPGPGAAAGEGAVQADAEEGAGRGPGSLVWHEVRVELRRPLLEAIVRPGYYR